MFRSSAKPFFGVLFVLVGTVLDSSIAGHPPCSSSCNAACSASCNTACYAEETAQTLGYAEETAQTLGYAEETPQEIVFSDDELVTDEKMANDDRGFRFIGDLNIGKMLQNQNLHIKLLKVSNPGNTVLTANYQYTAPRGVVHYLAILNVGGSNAAVYQDRHIIGLATARFSVRVSPRSTATLKIRVAYA